MRRETSDWQEFDSILCVRPDNLGDVLMTTPAIRALRHAHRGRRITLLTSTAGASVARHIPEIDDLVVFDPPWYRHARTGGADAVARAIEDIRERKFDAAVLFTVFSQNPLPNAMLCYQAGIPRVAGYCRENPYELITDWLPDKEPLYGARHEVQRQLDLATELGARPDDTAMSLHVPADALATAEQVLEDSGIDMRQPWLLLHPGASEARRRYPPERFAIAARDIAECLGYQVVITGTSAEAPLAESIADCCDSDVVSIAGRLDMASFIALVNRAPLLISNNTGPAHIAAAVQTPVVVLYALTNPQHAPWRVAHRVLPFDVPVDALSRNVLVRYASERFFKGKAGMAAPGDIVAAVADLLETSLPQRDTDTGLVSLAAAQRNVALAPSITGA